MCKQFSTPLPSVYHNRQLSNGERARVGGGRGEGRKREKEKSKRRGTSLYTPESLWRLFGGSTEPLRRLNGTSSESRRSLLRGSAEGGQAPRGGRTGAHESAVVCRCLPSQQLPCPPWSAVVRRVNSCHVRQSLPCRLTPPQLRAHSAARCPPSQQLPCPPWSAVVCRVCRVRRLTRPPARGTGARKGERGGHVRRGLPWSAESAESANDVAQKRTL